MMQKTCLTWGLWGVQAGLQFEPACSPEQDLQDRPHTYLIIHILGLGDIAREKKNNDKNWYL